MTAVARYRCSSWYCSTFVCVNIRLWSFGLKKIRGWYPDLLTRVRPLPGSTSACTHAPRSSHPQPATGLVVPPARPSDCLSSVCNVRASYTGDEIFGSIPTSFDTLAIFDLSEKILRRSSQGNPSVGGVKHEG